MRYRILGALEVLVEDEPVPLGGAKQRALLADLLVHANELMSVDRLIDDLWGERPPDSASNVIQTYVSRLRKAFEAKSEARTEGPLRTQRPGYALHVTPGELDLEQFEQLVMKARQSRERGELERAAAGFTEALRLWRGPALADLTYEPFLRAELDRLEELRLATLEDRIEADLSVGRAGPLVGELEALVKANPLRERLRGHLMLALYRSGRQAEALKVYQETHAALADELGIDPSQELQRLERAILNQDPALQSASPEVVPSVVPAEMPKASRSILLVPRDPARIDALIMMGELLARSEPTHELILTRLLPQEDHGELAAVTADLGRRRNELLAHRIPARAIAFTTSDQADDLRRLARNHPVDLHLTDGTFEDFDPGDRESALTGVLELLECDVAIMLISEAASFSPSERNSPILTPFGGADHDWAALHLAARIAVAQDAPLRLVGTAADLALGKRDASRVLADASLLVQHSTGLIAEPVLVEAGTGMIDAVKGAGAVVMGLSDRWKEEGLGEIRRRIAMKAAAPTIVLRRGEKSSVFRPGGDPTRFTWSRAPKG